MLSPSFGKMDMTMEFTTGITCAPCVRARKIGRNMEKAN